MTKLGDFWQIVATNFFTNNSPNILATFFSFFWKRHFFSKSCCSYFLDNIWIIGATLFSTIWSHWSKLHRGVSFQTVRRRRFSLDPNVRPSHYATNSCGEQCDQIALWATFQSQWQQLFCPNCFHSNTIFVKASKTFIFLVKSFWATFIDIWRLFSGHTDGELPCTFYPRHSLEVIILVFTRR